MNKLSARY